MSQESENRQANVPVLRRSETLERTSPATNVSPLVDAEGLARPMVPRDYWQVILRRRWSILAVLLGVLVFTTVGTLKQRPVYRASAVLQIDKENPNLLSFRDFLGVDNEDEYYLETAYKNLQSRTLARRVIDRLQLDRIPEFTTGSKTAWFGAVTPPKQINDDIWVDPKMKRVIENFLKRLAVNPVRRSRWVEITFESYDPVIAARVVNALASGYIENNLEVKFEATSKASEMISQQLTGLKVKLEKSEEDLQRYAKENSLLLLDEKQSMAAQKLKQLQEELTKAEGDLFQKQAVYNRIKNGEPAVPGMLENKLYQDLSSRLADLRAQYAELRVKFTPEYPRAKQLEKQITELAASLEGERDSLAQRIVDEFKSSEDRAKLLREAVGVLEREFNQMGEKSIQYNILKREVDTNRQVYEGMLQRLKEAGVSAGMKASNIRVVDRAEVPLLPAKPRVLLNIALALVAGLGLGLALAFFQEYLDDTLKTPEDVRTHVGLPVLAIIPSTLSAGKGYGYGYGYAQGEVYGGSQRRKELAKGNGGAAKEVAIPQVLPPLMSAAQLEAYRSLRTSILLSRARQSPRVIVVTSAEVGEGKTRTAVNLAATLAQLGSRVLLVDSDMRKPRIAAVLKLADSPIGLSTYLAGQSMFAESLVPCDVPNLHVLACGPVPPNPAELVSSTMMTQLLAEGLERFDYVILDSPPLLHVTDGSILATQAEVVLLVVHGGMTPRAAVAQAREMLSQVNANVIGVVLNNIDMSLTGYYRHYRHYRYGYGREESAEQQPADQASDKVTPVPAGGAGTQP
jgi:succinoglycan biosynthesis transport protein ExoP